MLPVRTVAPTETPVSLTEAKAHCRVDTSDDDTVLTAFLDAAVDHLDGPHGILGRCLVTQTWRQDFGDFTTSLRLPFGPVASITSITYYDSDDAMQTLSADLYALRIDELGAYIDLKPEQSWPSTYTRDDAVSVTFVAGVAAAAVPASIKAAILLLVSHWYENREAVVIGATAIDLPLSVGALLSPHRRMTV